MSIFRSQDMYLYKVVLDKDNEKAIVHILGDRNIAHFINMNGDEQVFSLPYIDLIKRCDETERKVVYLIDKCEFFHIKLQPAASTDEMKYLLDEMAKASGKNRDLLFDTVEREIWRSEDFIKTQTEKATILNTEANSLIENYNVVKRAGAMIYGAELIDQAIKNSFEAGDDRRSNSSDELLNSGIIQPSSKFFCFLIQAQLSLKFYLENKQTN
jgi:hypothetical protein